MDWTEVLELLALIQANPKETIIGLQALVILWLRFFWKPRALRSAERRKIPQVKAYRFKTRKF